MATHRGLVPPGPLADPAARRREQRSWYFFDWANSAYVTTTATVLFGPYLTAVAKADACPGLDVDARCTNDLSVLGIPVSPGSVAAYAVTVVTLLSAVLLPVVGAMADRTARKRHMMAGFAWVGAAAAAAMVLVTGTNWRLGVLLLFVANLCLGCALVVYDAVLCQIAAEDERDRVSSRGWALGYLGGGLLLAVNLALVTVLPFGLSTATAVRICLLSAGIWWAAWTIVPFLGLRDRSPLHVAQVEGGTLTEAFGQLRDTLRHLRGYPQTLTFLLAYLFYNDGIQTVIVSASIFGAEELALPENSLIAAILLVQFVAFLGALALGRLAQRYGSRRVVLASLLAWAVVVAAAFFLPEGEVVPFLVLAVAIGVVLGGSQALSRSLYSLLTPRGKEAEYFSLYQACERGTSWFGTLTFGLVYQFTGSYRYSIVALILFFGLGWTLLRRVDVREGIVQAGNAVPAHV